LYRRAVRASREGGSVEGEAKALNNLGTVCQWVGLVPEALAALQRSLSLKGRLGLHASAVLTKNNLGALHLAIGRHAEARAAFEEIVEHGRDATPIVVALGYSNWADLCTLEQDFGRAVDLYRTAHAINRERALAGQQSHALSGLTRVLVMRNQPGDLDEARELLANLERHVEHGDLAETHRRFHTSSAMYCDFIGDTRRMLVHARRVRSVREDPSAQFADVFGTLLESRWIEAIALARLGRNAQARRAGERTLATLTRLARRVGDARDQRAFLEASPLHRTICAQRLDTPLGWSWLPAAKDPRARPDETSVLKSDDS
jgi:tetratricopeptide (TPR) repeat protein